MNLRQVWLSGIWVAGVLWSLGASPALGQIVRPPELSMQYSRAEAAWRSGTSMLEAKARVDRVLRELPHDVEARKLRAHVLLAMDRPQEALADARRAVELAPRDGEAHLLLCEAAHLTGRDALARQALDEAAEYVLESAPLHIRLSLCAVALEQLDKAEAFARIALALGPNEAAAYYQLARVFMRQGKMDEAAEILARGLRSSILDVSTMERDTLLAPVRQHPALSAFTRN